MARHAILLVLGAVLFGSACLPCPKCAVDSQDGVGVSYISPLAPVEKGAVASVIQLLAVQAGPESPEIRALDSGLASGMLVIGYFNRPPRSQVRGYVLMKDGRLALDEGFVRAAALDAGYLSDMRTWPFIPVLYAAGHRLAHGGTWMDSVTAARPFAVSLAETVERGEASRTLPSRMDTSGLARALRFWQENF